MTSDLEQRGAEAPSPAHPPGRGDAARPPPSVLRSPVQRGHLPCMGAHVRVGRTCWGTGLRGDPSSHRPSPEVHGGRHSPQPGRWGAHGSSHPLPHSWRPQTRAERGAPPGCQVSQTSVLNFWPRPGRAVADHHVLGVPRGWTEMQRSPPRAPIVYVTQARGRGDMETPGPLSSKRGGQDQPQCVPGKRRPDADSQGQGSGDPHPPSMAAPRHSGPATGPSTPAPSSTGHLADPPRRQPPHGPARCPLWGSGLDKDAV